jgi:hypothetical protein
MPYSAGKVGPWAVDSGQRAVGSGQLTASRRRTGWHWLAGVHIWLFGFSPTRPWVQRHRMERQRGESSKLGSTDARRLAVSCPSIERQPTCGLLWTVDSVGGVDVDVWML